ncbi:hypothetical protein SNL152K_10192 [Streptomyces sp. NL15-2K]|nr:hypothetical protein SNL152K_10192 [Streptomyces sp. NL15-2K]
MVPDSQTESSGANHVNTWRIAYSIEGFRDWLFRRKKQGTGEGGAPVRRTPHFLLRPPLPFGMGGLAVAHRKAMGHHQESC